MLPSYWASILCRRSLHVSSLLHRMWESVGAGSSSGRTNASSRRPPTTRVNAYLVLRPPRGDVVGIRSYEHFLKETKTTTTTTQKKEKSLH